MNNKKRKIIFFGKLPPPFIGPAVATRLILNSDLKNHFDLIHFDISHHSSIDELGKITFKNFIYPFIWYTKLVYYILKYSPDIVYLPCQQTTIGFLRDIPIVLITKIFRVKLVCQLRGGYFKEWYSKECGPLMRFIIRNTQKMVDAQIVLGTNLIKLYSHLMPEKKIFVVPNAGDYTYPPRNLNNQKIRLLFLGNFIRTKGVVDFVKAGLELPVEYWEKVEFVMAGNWMEGDVKIEVEQLIEDNPTFPINNIGRVSGEVKWQTLANCDIFIFPTYYRNEGHPWVIVEAMGAGLPIIASDRGAVIESVIDGYNGFIVDKESPKKIMEKIKILLEDSSLRKQMGENSRRHYMESFREKNLVQNFKKVFDEV